jgi:hypothetical protein
LSTPVVLQSGASAALGGARHQRLAQAHAGVVEQVAGRKIIGAIDYHIVASHQRAHVIGVHAQVVQIVGDQVVEAAQGAGGGFDFGLAYIGGTVENLARQVGELYLVGVGQPKGAHTSGGQVLQDGAAQAARAHHQHAGPA